MKDIDGARETEFLVKGDSVFMWGRGFDYEFDLGIFRHQMCRLLGLVAAPETEKAPR